MRTPLAGEGERVCSRVGEGTIDRSGEIAGEGDSPGVGEGVGMGDSCAAAVEANANVSKIQVQRLVVILSEAQRSRRIPGI